ncbi:unnamed protein product [Diabrotica balteata]|uniref:Uncharacterized protein n=1 Tax=Diabrotica balteata TaxID=107213 RepID=A0A9N9T9B0_DIABA|nr:unnamed protein product [Diabrotica balteata]
MALLITNIKTVDVTKICRICLLHCDVTPLSDNHYDILIILQSCYKIQVAAKTVHAPQKFEKITFCDTSLTDPIQ